MGGRVLLAGLAGLALHRLERARRGVEAALWELARLEVSLAAGRGRRGPPGPHLAAAARSLGESLGDLEELRGLLERLAREAVGAEVSIGLCREDAEGPQAVVHIGRGGLAVELCEEGCGECEEHEVKPDMAAPGG